jgi:hypothetical protein
MRRKARRLGEVANLKCARFPLAKTAKEKIKKDSSLALGMTNKTRSKGRIQPSF